MRRLFLRPIFWKSSARVVTLALLTNSCDILYPMLFCLYTQYISKQPSASVNGKNSGGKSWVQLVNRKRSGVHYAARSLDKERCCTRGGKRWRRRWGRGRRRRRRRSRRIKRLWRRRWRWCSTQGQIRRSYIANFSVLAQCASSVVNTICIKCASPQLCTMGHP